jgi:hypothetical protein
VLKIKLTVPSKHPYNSFTPTGEHNMKTTNPSELYEQMLEVKSGKRGWVGVSKTAMRNSGIEWSFVEASCKILGLQLQPHGRHGYTATR